MFLTSCAKEEYQIGREDPEVEVQKCIHLSQKKHYDQAVECLEIFKSRFPNTAQGQEAGLRIADTYFVQHQYLLAADAYLAFTKLNPLHPKTEYAYYRAGFSYLKEAPKAIDRDQQYLRKAKSALKKALKLSAQGTYKDLTLQAMKEADRRLAKRLFYIGRFYYRTGEYKAAVPRLEELFQKYPKAEIAPKALYYLTKSQLALNKQEEARQAVQNLIENYPNNDWTKKAQAHYIKKAAKK